MPAYTTLCRQCGAKETIYRKIDQRDFLDPCPCGAMPERILEAPAIRPEIPAYHSPTDGRLITSRKERREDLARSNALEWEPGIDKDIARKRQYNIEESFKPISEAVDSIVRDMVVCGKLENVNA
jgi:hypothetical protein